MHWAEMKVSIFEGDTFVGDAEVFALDPPMRIAMARFHSAAGYDLTRHANVIDGDYVADRSALLTLKMPDGSTMKSEAISIQDLPMLSEREVHIIGIYEPNFDELFREHPDYKAYWTKD